MWRQRYEGRFFYQLYIQQPGVVEAEVGADTATALRMIYYGASGDANRSLFNRYRAQGLDGVRNFVPGLDLFDLAPAFSTDFRGSTIIPGVGHWVQQEALEATNAAPDAFVDALD